jgi:hypothetical protein
MVKGECTTVPVALVFGVARQRRTGTVPVADGPRLVAVQKRSA